MQPHEKLPLFHRLTYLVPNPWALHRPSERFRFEQTSKIIERELGTAETLVELGCGEGHQTVFLQSNCRKLIGVDCSGLALKRARRRAPGAEFVRATIERYLAEMNGDRQGRLIVAAEVLYYLPDPESALESIETKAGKGVVSLYREGQADLGPLLVARGWSGPAKIEHSPSEFYVYWFSTL